MLFPSSETCSGDKIWVFWQLSQTKDFVSLGVMECNRYQAEKKALALTAKEVFYPGTRQAKIRPPSISSDDYSHNLYDALYTLHQAFRRFSLSPAQFALTRDPIYTGYLLIQNPVDFETRAFAPLLLRKKELKAMPLLEKAVHSLLNAAEDTEKSGAIKNLWRRFPDGTQKKFEPA